MARPMDSPQPLKVWQSWQYVAQSPAVASGWAGVHYLQEGMEVLLPCNQTGATRRKYTGTVYNELQKKASQNRMYFMTVKLGSAFRTFLDPDPYSEYGCGSRQVKK